MQLKIQVLSQEECNQVHDRSLNILEKTGVKVKSARARQILGQAGANVEHAKQLVRFPTSLVEACLAQAPRKFALGSRRPGADVKMNEGRCTLLADGGASQVYSFETGDRRLADYDDWLNSTRLIDALDDIGIYWWMVRSNQFNGTLGDFVAYWRDVFRNTSKHIQDSTDSVEQTQWLLEILSIVFGSRETVRKLHPVSFLICPLSPLTLEASYTDALLETTGWDIPVAVMPMPLMGMTAPGRLISTVLLGNAEVLAGLCLVQAAAPGTPVIYAPALAVCNPRNGLYGSGAVEHALLGAAVTEMARYYGLPAEVAVGGTDHHIPGIQAGYERAINWALPILSNPDILVGPGLLSGSTVLSFEQIFIDVEIYQRCRRIQEGMLVNPHTWLEDVITRVGPQGNFLAERSTRDAVTEGEWYISKLGFHDTFEYWVNQGRPTLLEEVRRKIRQILHQHQPLPLDETTDHELCKLEARVRKLSPRDEGQKVIN